MKNKRRLNPTPICGIYSITNNINNKIYIGQSIDIERGGFNTNTVKVI